MTVPCPACRTVPARVERHDRHRVPGRPVVDTRAERRNRARHLVSQDGGHANALIHRAVEDMQVGAADAAVRDLYLYLPGRGFNRPALAQGNGSVARVECRSHDQPILRGAV